VPFTPLHLGPALTFGILLRKRIHLPTFIIANVYIDLEPLIVIILNLNYPLHGYLHTFLIAGLTGIGLGILMYFMESYLRPLWRLFKLEDSEPHYGLRSYFTAGFLGSIIHVFFDSPLYGDIKPFYPYLQNPLYDLILDSGCYKATVATVFYITLLLSVYGFGLYLNHVKGGLITVIYASLIYIYISYSLIIFFIIPVSYIVAYICVKKRASNVLRYLWIITTALIIVMFSTMILLQLTFKILCLKLLDIMSGIVTTFVVVHLHVLALKSLKI